MSSSIEFTNNYINAKLNGAVTSVNLHFNGAEDIINNEVSGPHSGTSMKLTTTFNGNNPPPKTFTVTSSASFPDSGLVTLKYGGSDDNTVEATDDKGNKGVWTILGSENN
ncbi:hypothetical protein Daesc_000242 [Daldinia eschscholtzii]|uniref:Uncharacterized protein n=1 Tax=Daldinia eschscholtzii TaxID=292717 RepID=A0AAX6MY60_9PEZI